MSKPIPSFENKYCLISGGSRGIGLEIAKILAASGATLALTYSKHDDDAEAARAAIAQRHGEALLFKGDAGNPQHVSQCVSQLQQNWPRIDVLINNAAINQMYPLPLLEAEDWNLMLQNNLTSAYLFSRAVVKNMIKQKNGRILNLGSFASERFIESPLHYAASKSGLRGLTEAMALEVGKYNILVNLLAPGLLDSGMSTIVPQHRVQEYLDHCSLGRLASAEEIARAAVFLVSDDNTFITGAKIVIDGGL